MKKQKSFHDIMRDKFVDKKTQKPNKIVMCESCGKKTLRLIDTEMSLVSDKYYANYECKCGNEESILLED